MNVFLKHFRINVGLKDTSTKYVIEMVNINEIYVFAFSALFLLKAKDNKAKSKIDAKQKVNIDGIGSRFWFLIFAKRPILKFEAVITKKYMNVIIYKMILTFELSPVAAKVI